MYAIYADNICIYNDVSPLEELRLISPKLELADNSAGSLSFSMQPSNRGYDLIQKMITTITVKKNDIEIWSGRPLSVEEDFWKTRKVFVEGELAYLNDTSQPPAEYHDMTVRNMLAKFIEIHNSKAPSNRQFTVGTVSVQDPNDSLYRYTNFENTLECISDKLVNRLGGHIRIRKVNGVRYIDYLADSDHTTRQTIEFGKNLLDYNKTFKMEDYATVIVPLGERLEESPIEALDAYLTVESVNDGSIYVKNEDGIAQFGWIEKIVHWDDVTEPSRLLTKANKYLSDLQFEDVNLEIKAVDLNAIDISAEQIKILDKVRVISRPHGMDRDFLVSKMSIPLDKPDNMTFTLGTDISKSLTASNNQANNEINKKIEDSASSSREKNKQYTKEQLQYYDNGIQMLTALMSQSLGTFKTEAVQGDGSVIYYMHDKPKLEDSQIVWRMTADGFMVSRDGMQTWEAGIDSQGRAVLSTLSAIGIQAGWIKAGTIEGEIIAKNLKMEGGSVNITTDEQTEDIIRFRTMRDNGYVISHSFMPWGTVIENLRHNTYGQRVTMNPVDLSFSNKPDDDMELESFYGCGFQNCTYKTSNGTNKRCDISAPGGHINVEDVTNGYKSEMTTEDIKCTDGNYVSQMTPSNLFISNDDENGETLTLGIGSMGISSKDGLHGSYLAKDFFTISDAEEDKTAYADSNDFRLFSENGEIASLMDVNHFFNDTDATDIKDLLNKKMELIPNNQPPFMCMLGGGWSNHQWGMTLGSNVDGNTKMVMWISGDGVIYYLIRMLTGEYYTYHYYRQQMEEF